MKHLRTISKFSFPILIGVMVLIVIGLFQGSGLIFSSYPYVLTACSLLVFILAMKKLANKKWISSALHLIGLPLILLAFYIMFYPRDLFFSNQPIPENVPYELPIQLNSKSSVDSLMRMEQLGFKCLLANYGQPGMYKSVIWTNLKEEGKLYLKAYDAINDFELERISEKTILTIHPNEQPISQEFTNYDGVWERYYLARFEVWFKPTNGSEDKKIGEQIFKVEGWIR